MKPKFHQYDENALKKAIEAVKNGGRLREICRQYGVPKSTVQDRIKGKVSEICNQMGPNPFLTKEYEQKIATWIENMSKCGFPIKKDELLTTVQKIVLAEKLETPFTKGRPGQTWYYRFMKRHPHLSLKNAESLEKYRSQITEEYIRSWFADLKSFLINSGAIDILEDPSRILNADESGFSLCPKTGKVLGLKGHSQHIVKKGNSKENLTALITFTADGRLCPPLVIFPYVKPPKALVESMPPDWILGKTDSGWMKSDVFYEFVANGLDKWLERKRIQKPVLFLVDGHIKSHMSLDLSTFCDKSGIILYALPPNATHLLQPADVGVFKPLKEYWRQEVREWQSKNENQVVTKIEFCPIFEKAVQNSNMSRNMKNGFKACGLYPFNPDSVDYSKCVQNVLEHLTNQIEKDHDEISETDIISTAKVISKLKPQLSEFGLCSDTILNLVKSLLPQKTSVGDDSFFMPHEIEEMEIVFDEPQQTLTTERYGVNQNNGLIIIHQDILLNPYKNEQSSKKSDLRDESPEKEIMDVVQDLLETREPILEEIFADADISESNKKQIEEKKPDEDLIEIDKEINNPHPDLKEIGNEKMVKEIQEFAETIEEESLEREITDSSQTQLQVEKREDSFEKHLSYPQPLQKTLKKRQREKIPSAISSGAWRKYYENKLREKEEKENAKKKRKVETMKKKETRKESKKTKSKVLNNKEADNCQPGSSSSIITIEDDERHNQNCKLKCSECDEELESDTEIELEKNVGCDLCSHWYHLGCTKFSGLTYEVTNLDFVCRLCNDE